VSPAELGKKLEERFPEHYLGQREDRGEWTFWVDRAAWVEAARYLSVEHGYNFLSDLTAVDYLDRDPRFDLSAILLSWQGKSDLRLKTLIPEADPRADTLTGVWAGANWYEREIFDMFGIEFDNHPALMRLLLPPDYVGHPLRKDYPVTGPADSPYR